MNAAIRQRVRERAGNRCEYCLLSQDWSPSAHQIEHILPRKHGGSDQPENLAFACNHCNLSKGPNLTGIDPLTGKLCSLFHPRMDHWKNHFRITGTLIKGLTAKGRATVAVLAMNDPRRLKIRHDLIRAGRWP